MTHQPYQPRRVVVPEHERIAMAGRNGWPAYTAEAIRNLNAKLEFLAKGGSLC